MWVGGVRRNPLGSGEGSLARSYVRIRRRRGMWRRKEKRRCGEMVFPYRKQRFYILRERGQEPSRSEGLGWRFRPPKNILFLKFLVDWPVAPPISSTRRRHAFQDPRAFSRGRRRGRRGGEESEQTAPYLSPPFRSRSRDEWFHAPQERERRDLQSPYELQLYIYIKKIHIAVPSWKKVGFEWRECN